MTPTQKTMLKKLTWNKRRKKMGLEDILKAVFGTSDAKAYEKAVQFIDCLVYPGIITEDEAARIIKQFDEIENMKG